MNKTEGLPFRSFVPGIVANLEDPDGMVRDTAKNAIVELFQYVVPIQVLLTAFIGTVTDLCEGLPQNMPSPI
jgi:hypothetical protein